MNQILGGHTSEDVCKVALCVITHETDSEDVCKVALCVITHETDSENVCKMALCVITHETDFYQQTIEKSLSR
jgi:hypothetical protein